MERQREFPRERQANQDQYLRKLAALNHQLEVCLHTFDILVAGRGKLQFVLSQSERMAELKAQEAEELLWKQSSLGKMSRQRCLWRARTELEWIGQGWIRLAFDGNQ